MKDKIKVLFLTPSLGAGGAEKVLSTLLRGLDRNRFDVSLVVINRNSVFPRLLPADLDPIFLNTDRVRYALPAILKLIRKMRPDVVFTTLGYLNLAILLLHPLLPSSTLLIGREAIVRSVNNCQSRPFLLDGMYRLLYRHFHTIVCPSMDVMQDLCSHYGIPKSKLIVIPNPVDIEELRRLGQTRPQDIDSSMINLVAAGRLEFQKGFDLLMRALAQACRPDMNLRILGNGSQSSSLQALAFSLGIEASVRFLGLLENPYPYFQHSDAFVLSSRFEGFPNVAVEALACGTPVLAFACPGGLNEIILHGVNGLLVRNGDIEGLAEALHNFKRSHFDRSAVIDSVARRYPKELILEKYSQLFMSAMK